MKKTLTQLAVLGLSASVLTACSAEDPNLGAPVPSVKFSYYSSDYGAPYERSARVIADELSKLGVNVELNPVQFNTFVDEITLGGNLDGMALGGIGGDPNRIDPNFWLTSLSECDEYMNVTKWCSEEYDKVAQAQGQSFDEAERKKLVSEAQEIFAEEAPWWTVVHQRRAMIWNQDRWDNVVSPSPIAPHETTVNPWLDMTPKADDRIIDWAHLEDVSTYNPLLEYTGRGWMRMIYDTFLSFDEGELVPWAAEDWEFVDDTTLEVTLREGMDFHDGTPVTAKDAVFSLNLVLEEQPAGLSDAVEPVEGVEQVDDLTFRINLSEPTPTFPTASLTTLFILPEHIWKNVEDPLSYDPIADDAVVGSGPFAFESWEPSVSHQLSTSESHWAAPGYDGIRRLNLGQADAVRAALADGTADLAFDVLPGEAMERLAEEQSEFGFTKIDTLDSTVVWTNHEQAPFDDVEFRKAMRLVTHPERVAGEGWLGFATPGAGSNVPAVLDEWVPEDLGSIGYDVDQARQILEDAGYGWDAEGKLHYPQDNGGGESADGDS